MQTFTWIDFLNEACTWESREKAELFLARILGAEIHLQDDDIRRLSALEALLRNQLSALHFEGAVDYATLNEHLGRVHLVLTPPSSVNSADGSVSGSNAFSLPVLQASVHGFSGTDRFIDTMLFHFVSYVSTILDGSSPHTVYRCEAMYRKGVLKDAASYYRKNESLESRWKEEMDAEYSKLEDLERCCDFFTSTQRGKFCSDTCRFSTYALKRRQQDPEYQAEKQRRYRERQKQKKA